MTDAVLDRAKFDQCIVELAQFLVGPAKPQTGWWKRRIHLQDELQLLRRLVVLSGVVVMKPEVGVDPYRKWIALLREQNLTQCLRPPA